MTLATRTRLPGHALLVTPCHPAHRDPSVTSPLLLSVTHTTDWGLVEALVRRRPSRYRAILSHTRVVPARRLKPAVSGVPLLYVRKDALHPPNPNHRASRLPFLSRAPYPPPSALTYPSAPDPLLRGFWIPALTADDMDTLRAWERALFTYRTLPYLVLDAYTPETLLTTRVLLAPLLRPWLRSV